MGLRTLVIGIAVSSVLASSCASSARDAFVDIFNDEAGSSSDEACRINIRTFATATDAYVAVNGTMPTSTSDLVPGYLREVPDAWVFDPGSDSSFSPAEGERCDGIDLERRTSDSFGQAAVDGISDSRDVACAEDKRLVGFALETHYVVTGGDAKTMDDLVEFGVTDELNRWTLEIPADAATAVPTVVPIAGGPCDG